MAVPYTFGSATTSIPLSQLDSNFATAITLGNTAVQLGNTITTLTGVSNLASATSLTLGSNGNTTALTIATNQAITVANTGNGITYSSSGGSGMRMYGSSGTNQWDLYLNGANIRFSDNTGGGIVVVDTAARYGSTIGVGGTTPANTGAGISFPATQSASSDANTLDDYEEGTFTVGIRGSNTAGTYTISSQTCNYTKVGRLVSISINISGFSAATGGVGYMQITGLPFTNTTALAGQVQGNYLDVSAGTLWVTADFITGSGTTTMYMRENKDATSGADFSIGGISTSTTVFILSFSYQTST